ncbi:hypothetical protein HB780_03175 (plasmid) [Rhizobium lusitanum]|uniref:hypothetical protein n=1 Tax=Rhizobium lusitanum TaxID=293958 RepID=UPI00161D4FE2|nr:hypothetical protein [Rhizobium lusitanum]QND44796.1 hypothetical protein HB780_03175 [Rhizobium lusitanum]
MPRLHVHNISLAFGSTKTVAHASLTIEAAKVVVLIGANGACEPILAENLFGLYRPGAGKTLYHDKEIAQENPAEASASGIVAGRQSTDMVGISSLAVMTALRSGPAAPLHAPHHLGHRMHRRSAQRPHRVEYRPFYAQDPIKRIAWAKN